MAKDEKLNIVHVDIDKIKPRELNANQMDEDKFQFLVDYMSKAGYVQPIITVSNDDGTYTIVDGEHRWKAAQANKITKLDIVVVDLDLKEQDIMCINMNQIHGELNPAKFGALLRSITSTTDAAAAEQLSHLIAMERAEIDAYLKITEEVEESEYASGKKEAEYHNYKFKVSVNDLEFFEDCFERVRCSYKTQSDDDILYNLCAFYLSREGDVVEE